MITDTDLILYIHCIYMYHLVSDSMKMSIFSIIKSTCIMKANNDAIITKNDISILTCITISVTSFRNNGR